MQRPAGGRSPRRNCDAYGCWGRLEQAQTQLAGNRRWRAQLAHATTVVPDRTAAQRQAGEERRQAEDSAAQLRSELVSAEARLAAVQAERDSVAEQSAAAVASRAEAEGRPRDDAPPHSLRFCDSYPMTKDTNDQPAAPQSRRVVFDSDLPPCCEPTKLHLPRPHHVIHRVTGGMDPNIDWNLGLNYWIMTVGVEWDEGDPLLTEAIATHLGLDDPAWEDVEAALADHGIEFDTDHNVWVGAQECVTATLYSDLNRAAGREYLHNGDSLFYSADAESNDLNELVAPIVDLEDPTMMWSEEVLSEFEDAEDADLAILLRSVRITPVMRGHHLGAWAAAQAIAMFDHGRSLVATMAAPLARQDGVSGFIDDHQDFTDDEQTLWNLEQTRLAAHWAKHLGLTALASHPNVLVWHSAQQNEALDKTLALWT